MDIVRIWLWLAATLGHFALTARWCRRLLGPASTTPDEWTFFTAVCGVGALSLVLHASAITVGISLSAGLVGLLVWHAVALVGSRVAGAEPEPGAPRTELCGIEVAAMTVGAGILLSWVDVASGSMAIAGTDAAHYHVPHAINFALGVGFFALPATGHLYPMDGSVVAAWFVVPFSDGLLIDLVMALWFVLLASSANHLFRLLTGRSGLAWSSWLVVALFATPLFRTASLVSADLPFAASFVALLTGLTSVWVAGRWRLIDSIGIGLSAGLLIGSKASGPAAAGLLGGFYVAAAAARRFARKGPWAMPEAAAMVVAVVCALGAGGVWVIRNLVLFGWLIEPWQPTTYLSVLGDLQSRADYSLWQRARYFTDPWIGGLAAGVPILLTTVMLADLVAAMRSKVQPELASARGFAATGAVLVGGVLVALLVRSPWTSLEWTGGMSLRYVLPLFVLIGTFGLTAGFPLSWRWPDSRRAADVVGAAAAAVSVCWLLVSQHPGAAHFSAVPRMTLGFLVAGFALVAALGLSVRATPRTAAVGALVLGIATVWAPLIAARDVREQAAAKKLEQQEWLVSADPRARVRAARQIYFQTLDAELREARTCARRQFFVLTRFDEPLALQSTVYRNVMFYAARDVALAERAGPIGSCDYIITSRAVMDTDKGHALVAALAHGAATREVAVTTPFVVLATALPQ